MPLETFAALDAVPEDQRSSAIETKDGKFVVYRDEDVTGLKNTVSSTRKERDEAKRRAAEIESELARLKEEAEAAKNGLSGEKLEEIRRKAEEKFKPVLDERDALRTKYRQRLLDGDVKARLSAAGVIDATAAWKIVGEEFDLTDDEKVVLKADPTADIEQHIKGELRKRYPFLFKGTEAAGGGAGGGGSAGAGGLDADPTKWSSDERRAYIESNGAESYRARLDAHQRNMITKKAS